jgi:predicted glutamine amidotransferase
MCELFAMSSRLPAAVTFSLETLARHAGGERPSCDGWGVAFYDEPDARVLREPKAAYQNPWVDFIEKYGPQSKLVLSHIRHASMGEKRLANTHPFSRALGGRLHAFAHNGNVKEIFERRGFSIGRHQPIGDTDSERAFCALLARLEPLWTGDAAPSPAARYDIVAAFAADLRPLGPANFVYTDGEYLFAFGDRRRQQDGRFVAPGLHILTRHCGSWQGKTGIDGVSIESQEQTILLLASVPLTNEAWRPLGEGELLMARHGGIMERGSV